MSEKRQNGVLAQSVEHLTFNQVVRGSIPDASCCGQKLKKKADQKQKDADQMLIGIKPNLVSPTEASYGATTHPEIVAGIIEYLQERSCQHIVMLESSWVGDKTSESMEVCGYDRLVEKYNVPFWDMRLDESSEVDCAGMRLQICKAV